MRAASKLLLAVLVAVAVLSTVDSAGTSEAIGDGGFESASLLEVPSNERTYDGWAASKDRGGTISLVNSPAWSGSQAAGPD